MRRPEGRPTEEQENILNVKVDMAYPCSSGFRSTDKVHCQHFIRNVSARCSNAHV